MIETCETEILVDDRTVIITVLVESRGSSDPDDGPSWEIAGAVDLRGEAVSLTRQQEKEAADQVLRPPII